MGQSPFRVKAGVKYIFIVSPEAVARRSSRGEQNASDIIADWRNFG